MILRIILILLSFDCVLVLFPQTNPIGGITLLLGDLLNFVVSNKKLSIMNKFVEITVDGKVHHQCKCSSACKAYR